MKAFNLFKDNIHEISESQALQWYGAILCFSHLATAFFWRNLTFKTEAVCWPFFSNCQALHSIAQNYYIIYIICLALIALLSMIFFILKNVELAYILFFIATLMKFLFQALDYRLMGNYHYMSHIINFSFLILLNKKDSIKLLIVLFYLAAGIIKFNTDWLSGLSMLTEPIVKGKALEFLCAYVIILELFIVLFMLSNNRNLKYFAFFNLICFHLFSWHIVGYFYPTIMFSILSLFVLDQKPFAWPKFLLPNLVVLLFLSAQIYPAIFEPLSSLNGRGRILALNMLDATSICETHYFIRYRDHWIEHSKRFQNLGVRIQCDMVMVVHYSQQLCHEFSAQSDFIDIDFDHQVRRVSDTSITEQETFQNVCSRPVAMGFLGKAYQKETPHD